MAKRPNIEIRGWVRTRRDSKGGFSFIEINDGSSLGNLQVVAPGELDNYVDEVQKITAGCSVVVRGPIAAFSGERPVDGTAREGSPRDRLGGPGVLPTAKEATFV